MDVNVLECVLVYFQGVFKSVQAIKDIGWLQVKGQYSSDPPTDTLLQNNSG